MQIKKITLYNKIKDEIKELKEYTELVELENDKNSIEEIVQNTYKIQKELEKLVAEYQKTLESRALEDKREALNAQKAGASYIMAGHIYKTACKEGLEPRGIKFLKKICATVNIPVYAIGGININNARECIEAGASGVCLMSGYMHK